MCLGIPAKIISITDKESATALVETAGVKREACISLLSLQGNSFDDLIGQWVLLHVGFAMAVIDQDEALRTLALLASLEG
ncbi:HypC/HybG/HupF family hydrogenase formation chaperone [Zooshikella harenae]|uniref:HypC/HybG/HupF family hydrogenase formation chaperone n=1 Tax=Zooshikella harenae TaxID=2827238 RepID=A0ABS5ZE16_9GAMM|nr:HypC/HybG/HupF family hydrogenase formation chaperone [Zooshikella harenae]MBU2712311.1 HypC/HybG/HupF family hydrogenase formation chaperone [Zooshikella harenae]